MPKESRRSSNEEAIHNMIIGLLVEFYEKLGFEVRADHLAGFRECPDPIGSYVPDLFVKKRGDIRVIEVETRSTIDTPKTRRELTQFSSAKHKLVLAIPHECLEAAVELRTSLGIDFEILPCYPMVRYVGVAR